MDLTIVDYNLEWERNRQERELDRKRAKAALYMQKIFRFALCVSRAYSFDSLLLGLLLD